MKSVYTTFGMTYKLELSTRPKKALGEKELWDRAEAALARAMDTFAGEGNWRVNPGDGAFYGPKVDIKVMDAMERVHQCATIQLDFQLPIRFNLQYNTGSNEEGNQFARPVIVHRAMLGSVERMFAVLCEHYTGGSGRSGFRHDRLLSYPFTRIGMSTANRYGTDYTQRGFMSM